MNKNVVDEIKSKIEVNFENGGFKLRNAHFENGRNLHSEQYYFAKKYFQNIENCNQIAALLCSKLQELKFPDSTTLIGLQSYTGLLLSKAVDLLGKYDYAIVEQSDDIFVWQNSPKFEETTNLVIILPITCTCSTYIKLRKFLTDYIKNVLKTDKIEINNNFINVFLILDESLKAFEEENIKIDDLKEVNPTDNKELFTIYSAFNWTEISKNKIFFNNNDTVVYEANPLIRLYSKMYLPESCPLCFPQGDDYNEKPIFPTHDNYETPNLIFGFHNFKKIKEQRNFLKTFASDVKEWNILLSGHINVDEDSYSSYIRGNVFYEKNKDDILDFFDEEIDKRLPDDDNIKKVIFITAENKHNSNFLEDITLRKSLKKTSVTILRFQPENEFVDNFISIYKKELTDPSAKVIYFEEVLAAGKTFKLVSNYIKHARKSKNISAGRHGFDLVLTLVDRTPLFTKNEIIKKIFSEENPDPENNFISFFSLNVPIFSATHLGNPLKSKNENLLRMLEQSHLDSLKITISNEITKRRAINLPELDLIKPTRKFLKNFLFGNIERDDEADIFKIYKHFNRERLELLKLNLSHEIYCELARPEYQEAERIGQYKDKPEQFVDDLLKKINLRIKDNISDFFILPEHKNSPSRKIKKENEIIHDLIVKLLSQPPFIYYKNIYEPIFHYCISQLDKIYQEIINKGIRSFETFRKLRFYIRRSVDLNSNYMISRKFLGCIKAQYTKERFEEVIIYHNNSKDILFDRYKKEEIDDEYYEAALSNVDYKIEKITSFFSDLQSYYKELVSKNPSKSIKLEELLNDPLLFPKEKGDPENREYDLEQFIKDPYFHFIGMVKAENIYLLDKLKEFHKQNIEKQTKTDALKQIKHFKEYDNVRKYYFIGKENNPVVIDARKLIEKSRHKESEPKHDNIKRSISNMLLTIGILEQKKKNHIDLAASKNKLNAEIKEILGQVKEIIEPGISQGKLQYAFFVKLSKTFKNRPKFENIYSITSDEAPDDLSAVKLSEEGLIYNMLNGLYASPESKNIQTLIAGIKLGKDEIVSFKDNYHLADNSSPQKFPDGVSFSKLYKKDYFNNATRQGIKLLDSANMALVFRFANLIENSLSNKYDLEGRAVLLITNTEKSNLSNFIEFLSDEKVRLLLLIKEELLDYLQKQLNNDAFIEVLENKQRANYQRSLRHGLAGYIDSLEYLTKDIDSGKFDSDDYELFQIITQAMKGQIQAIETSLYKDNITLLTRENLQKIIRLIFKTPNLASRSIDFNSIDFGNYQFESIKTNKIVLDVILPEILINMKKYCPRYGEKGLAISYNKKTNTFTFQNKIISSERMITAVNKKGGLMMCREIMEKLELGSIEKRDINDICTVNLSLVAQ